MMMMMIPMLMMMMIMIMMMLVNHIDDLGLDSQTHLKFRYVSEN